MPCRWEDDHVLTVEDLFEPHNIDQAIAVLMSRRGGAGPDGMPIAEVADHWRANGARIEASIRAGEYRPGTASIFEVVTGTGKRREVASINVVDRLIERMLHQVLSCRLEPRFLDNSLAYRPGKAPLDAAILARSFVESGNDQVCVWRVPDARHVSLDELGDAPRRGNVI